MLALSLQCRTEMRTREEGPTFHTNRLRWNILGSAISGAIGPLAVLRLVRLLAAVRAVSCKNTPKNNIYTSTIIIPARTLRH